RRAPSRQLGYSAGRSLLKLLRLAAELAPAPVQRCAHQVLELGSAPRPQLGVKEVGQGGAHGAADHQGADLGHVTFLRSTSCNVKAAARRHCTSGASLPAKIKNGGGPPCEASAWVGGGRPTSRRTGGKRAARVRPPSHAWASSGWRLILVLH